MTNAIDRESVAQLKKELKEVLSSEFITSHQLTLVDVQLMVQVIQEWEHNEDAHLQGEDLVDGYHHSHCCRVCGYSYTPSNDCTEDCPRCGYDGT